MLFVPCSSCRHAITGRFCSDKLPFSGPLGLTTGCPKRSDARSSPSAAASLFAEGESSTLRSSYLDAGGKFPRLPSDFPALPDVPPLEVTEVKLDNGLEVVLVEDHEVPLVRGQLVMRGGKFAVRDDNLGVATLTAGAQRLSGSRQHPGESFDAQLEDLAASIEINAGDTALTVGFRGLAADAPELLTLLNELVGSPKILPAKVQLIKRQIVAVLERRNDSASQIAQRELLQRLYGRDSLIARSATAEQVNALKVADVEDFIRTWQRPDTAILGIIGDFDTTQMLQTIEATLGTWRPVAGQPASPPVAPLPVAPESNLPRQILFINKPDSGQATVAMGQLGVNMRDADFYPLEVLNAIFNGFGGALFNELRSKQGLVYDVAGGWSTPPFARGTFGVSAETDQPGRFIAETQRLLDGYRNKPPQADRLSSAVKTTINSFVFNFASKGAQLQRLLVFKLVGLPENFLYEYKDGLEKVDEDTVLAAAQRWLQPPQLVVVVCGIREEVMPQLEALGEPVMEVSPP